MRLQARYRRGPIRLLVVDVDQTLFDWSRVWARTYRALIDRTAAVTGVAEEDLLDALGALHREHGSSEVAAPLGLLPLLEPWHRGSPEQLAALQTLWSDAVSIGHSELAPYPGVLPCLQALRHAGTRIVACSETSPGLVADRLVRLGLRELVQAIAVPAANDGIGNWPLVETGAVKPEPQVLRRVCTWAGVLPQEATCVGDHLHKDVAMAQAAGLHDVWARYGAGRSPDALALLERLRHWHSPTVDVDRFGAPPLPSVTLEHSLEELLSVFEFTGAG